MRFPLSLRAPRRSGLWPKSRVIHFPKEMKEIVAEFFMNDRLDMGEIRSSIEYKLHLDNVSVY